MCKYRYRVRYSRYRASTLSCLKKNIHPDRKKNNVRTVPVPVHLFFADTGTGPIFALSFLKMESKMSR
jgi:hypothetical protein